MAYVKKTWVNKPNTTTPILANDLNHMEQGIYDATYENGLNVSNEVDEDYRVNVLHSKNLFDINNKIENSTISSNGTITNNSGTNIYYIPIEYGKNYIMSFIDNSTGGNVVWGFSNTIPYIGVSSTYNVNTCPQLNNKVFTAPASSNKYLCIRLATGGGQLASMSNIQIEEGSTATTYSAFVPNSIKVNGYDYTETIGVGVGVNSANRVNLLHSKNLCNLLDTTKFNYRYKGTSPYYQSFIPIEILSNKIKVRPGGGNYTEGYIDIKGLKPNTKYSISYTILENTTNFNPTITISNSGVTDANGDITLNLLLNNGGTSSVTSTYVVYGNIQLEEGNTATTYEPYITPSIYVDGEEIYSKGTEWTTDISGVFSYRKINGVVYIRFNDKQITTTSGTWLALGTLPSGIGIRPSQYIVLDGANNGVDGKYTTAITTTGSVRVRTITPGTDVINGLIFYIP